jgi:Zn-dependent protease
MGGTPQFRLAGVPVRVELWFLLTALLVGVSARRGVYLATWVVIVFVSVLVHELGHAAAFRAHGQQPSISLIALVGLTYGDRPLRTRRQQIVVSLAGPLTQIVVLGLPARWLYDSGRLDGSDFWRRVVYDVALVSLVWGVANLLPILPLDGGHICEAIVGRSAARYVSVATAIIATVWLYANGYGTWLLLLLGLLSLVEIWSIRRGGGRVVVLPEAPAGGRTVDPPPTRRRGDTRKRNRSRSHLRAVPDPDDVGALTAAAPEERRGPDADQVEAVAWDGLRRGDLAGVRRALARHPSPDKANPFLLASAALAEGSDDALIRFRTAYLGDPNGPASLVPATLLGRSGLAPALARDLLAANGKAGATGARAAANLQSHLHYASAYQAAVEVGALVHADGRSSPAQAAFEVACSQAQAGDPKTALEWLQRAVDAGFSAGGLLDAEPDLEVVRALPDYAHLRRRVAPTQ